MPQQVCRIRWRRGSPLRLSVTLKTSYLDLPPELRDEIYIYSLISPNPITLWCGVGKDETDHSDLSGNITRSTSKTVNSTNVSTLVKHFALNLLQCNRQVAREAATIFYRRNTFRFMGQGNWNPLYVFLGMIGEDNRGNLRSIEMHMPKPDQVWQHADGTCTSRDDWRFREVKPQSTHWLLERGKSTSYVEGYVDHFDPAIEACFRVLGKIRSGRLTLTMMLDRDRIPGVELYFDEQHPDSCRFDVKFPVVMEELRQEFTTASQVQILWKGKTGWRDRYAERKELIRKTGWEIIDEQEGEIQTHFDPILTMLYTLCWKETSMTSASTGIEIT